jgi:hypothetical protein
VLCYPTYISVAKSCAASILVEHYVHVIDAAPANTTVYTAASANATTAHTATRYSSLMYVIITHSITILLLCAHVLLQVLV